MRDRSRFESEVAALAEIFPPNSLQRVINTTVAPFRWICQIETTLKNGELSGGTGVLIGPRHVLTSAHVIYPTEPGEPRPRQQIRGIRVFPGRHGSREPFGEFKANGWAIRPAWLAGREANCTFDYGLIRLKENLAGRRFSAIGNQPLGFWGQDPAIARFAPIDPATLNGADLFTAGYPWRRGLNDFAARVMNQSEGRALGALQVTRCTEETFAGHPITPIPQNARLLQHDVDTVKGQSGGPVWTRNGGVLTLAAIHFGGFTPNRGSAFNAAVIVTQEVFDQVNHWIRHFVE